MIAYVVIVTELQVFTKLLPYLGNDLLSNHESMISLISFSQCSPSASHVPSTVLKVYGLVGNTNRGLKQLTEDSRKRMLRSLWGL